ncbi:MAG: argininosuccinate lyase [Halobacteriales archaeon]
MVRKVEFPKKKGKFACWLSREEVKHLIEQCTESRDEEIILTLLSSGLRVHEACKASSEDIFEDDRGLMIKIWGKNSRYREAPIPATLKTADLPITRKYNGIHRPISTNTALAWVKKAGKNLGCPELSPHDLRRSYASILLESNIDPTVIMEWLGWSSWETFQRFNMNVANLDFQKHEREKLNFLHTKQKMTNDSSDIIRGTRFSGGPARNFLSSMDVDHHIFDADIAVDLAHVVMLAEENIISKDNAKGILEALFSIHEMGFESLPPAEDVHAAIETAVVAKVGDSGGRMHTARSRNDEVSTCIRYQLRSDILSLLNSVLSLRETILSIAKSHTSTLIPGFTHLQSAQPSTLSHWLVSYYGSLERDTNRLFDAYSRINLSPLGSAAFAGTPFPINRERTATLLGFEGIIENTMDAVSSRDFLLESAAALCSLSITFSNMSEDLIFYSNKSFVEIDDDYASTSSIMPQKKNPDTLELIRAAAATTLATFSGTFTTLKGLPRAYNRDLQSATPYIWNSVEKMIDSADILSKIIETSTWNVELLSSSAGEGFSTATGVADTLAMAGIPFRKAHQIIAKSESNYEDISSNFNEIMGSPLSEFCTQDSIESALDPLKNVDMRDSLGGPSPTIVLNSISNAKNNLKSDFSLHTVHKEKIDQSKEKLIQEAMSYLK